MGIEADNSGAERTTALLEHLRDGTFYLSPFSERKFHDTHYHCASCWKRIAEHTDPNAEHEGYVAANLVQYHGFPPSCQYSWLCKDCFPKLQNAYGWKVSTGEPPQIPKEAERSFQLAYREYLSNQQKPFQQNHSENQYASVTWVPRDIMGIAKTIGVEMTEEAAAEFLALSQNHIRSEMIGSAVQLIRELIGSKRRE